MALLKSQKHAFWQALVVALIMFNLGIFFGYMLERNRVKKIDELYVQSELELLDIRLQNEIYSIGKIDCKNAIDENMKFADKIYEEAKILQRYEDASRISDAMIIRHKKYDLLRTQLWINSIKLKKVCNSSYHTVVYLYQYVNSNPTIEVKANQNVFSRLLAELKERKGGEIILIPIAGDNEFVSLEMLKKIYNVTQLPTILIDEKYKITELTDINELEKYVS